MADVAAAPVKQKSALEKEMEALLGATAGLMKETKEASKGAAKIRRKSKELEGTLNDMASASDAWQALGGRRSRRGSRDYTDEALQQAFNEIDSDKSGHIDREELEKAIMTMDPNCKPETVDEMMKFADDDEDGKVTFEEFKKIMLYKPSQSETGEAK